MHRIEQNQRLGSSQSLVTKRKEWVVREAVKFRAGVVKEISEIRDAIIDDRYDCLETWSPRRFLNTLVHKNDK